MKRNTKAGANNPAISTADDLAACGEVYNQFSKENKAEKNPFPFTCAPFLVQGIHTFFRTGDVLGIRPVKASDLIPGCVAYIQYPGHPHLKTFALAIKDVQGIKLSYGRQDNIIEAEACHVIGAVFGMECHHDTTTYCQWHVSQPLNILGPHAIPCTVECSIEEGKEVAQ